MTPPRSNSDAPEASNWLTRRLFREHLRERALYGQSWVWINNVIFGAIAARGFAQLALAIQETESAGNLLPHVYAAGAAYTFLLYDVTVYQWLVRRYPFRYSGWSGLRLVLDTLMAFGMAVIVLTLTRPQPYLHTRLILLALLGWHALTVVWHISAHGERSRRFPSIRQMGPHIAATALYGLAFTLIQCLEPFIAGVWKLPMLLWVLLLFVLVFSAYRSSQVLATIRAQDTTRQLEGELASLTDTERLSLCQKIRKLELNVEHFDTWRTVVAAAEWSKNKHPDLHAELEGYLQRYE